MKVKYPKAFLTFEEQADLLVARGMIGDRDQMVERLRTVSYFRLSGYCYPFRRVNPNDPKTPFDDFKSGTAFEEVWTRYVFDRRLRLIVMDAIERIEVTVRAQLANHHAGRHGMFAYATDPQSMPSLNMSDRLDLLNKINTEQMRSKDPFAKHFHAKYSDQFLPLWMAAEVMTFGTLLTFHRGSHQDIRRLIAVPFGVHDTVFASWLLSLNTVRNICAHHGRLWNREMGTKPKIPDQPQWRSPVAITNDRMFGILSICKWSLDRIAPQSAWSSRLRSLIKEFPSIPLVSMGFDPRWTESPIWQAR